MKNRLMIFVLCVVFAFSNITVTLADGNAAAEPIISNNNLAFAQALGLIDDGVSGEDNFSRADLAKLVSKILLYNSASIEDAEYESIFSDVESEDVPYVMTAVNYGILNGVGDGKFMPDSNVTYIQLIKAMIGILGRNEEAIAKGGYPTGYYAVANQQDITEYAPPDINYEINVNAVANVLKQMVNANVAYVDADGQMEVYDKSYLNYFCAVGHISGVVDACMGVSLSSDSAQYDVVTIGGQNYKIADVSMLSPNLLGTRVDLFYKKVGSANTAIYIEQSPDSNFFLDACDIESVSENGYTYYDGEKEKTLRIKNGCAIICNNVLLGNYTLDALNPFKGSSKDGNIVLVDSDDDKIYDVVKITAYDSYVVSSVQNDIVYSKTKKFSVDLSKLEENSVVNILLESINPDTIESGDILNVMTDPLGNITQIIVTIDAFSGVVDGISYNGSMPETVEVAGKFYKCSKSLCASPNLSDLKVGAALKLYFNPDGRICEVDAKGFETTQIAYLIDAKKKDGMDESYLAQILTSDGEVKMLSFAKKVSVSVGDSDVGTKPASDAISYAGKTNARVKRQPVKYALNSSGEISQIKYPDFNAPVTEDGFYQYPDFDGVTDLSSYYYRASSKNFGTKLLMGNNTIVFRVAEEASRDDKSLYGVATPSDLLTGPVRFNLEAYGMYAGNPMADILAIRINSTNAYEVTDAGHVYVVKSITKSLNADGEEIAKLTVVGQNSEKELMAEPQVVSGIVPGDVIKYALEGLSLVKNIKVIFSAEQSKLVGLSNPSQSSVSAGTRYCYGTVVYADDNSFTIRIGTGQEATYESYPFAVFKKVVVDRSRKTPDVYVGSSELLLGENDYANLASKVFIHTSSLDCETLVIYK